jgi:F-type H+-transporting ATPase subunit delta
MEEIARVYARALFEAAKELGLLDEIREQLAQFVQALNSNRQFAIFCFSPNFSTEEKEQGLQRAVTGAEPIFMNFLQALVERHRMPAIFRIGTRYEELWKQENRLLPVEVTSAVTLDDATIAEIGERVGKQAGRKIELSSRVDPDILGGLVLRVGNAILDSSIRSRLNQLRKQVARAS